MVELTRIYTKGGDKGKTSLGDFSRVNKYDLRVTAYGTVDEANSFIGLMRLHTGGAVDDLLSRIQNDLFDLGADLCTPRKADAGEEAKSLRIHANQTEYLETKIDEINADLSALTSFILPGGTPGAAYGHVCRTTVRRAERLVVELGSHEAINEEAIRYLNRLSDLMFVLARHLNANGTEDILWVPGANRK